jgi:uncharacterized membrane protein YkvI
MQTLMLVLLLLSTLVLSGCEVVEGIFQAGLWVGAILVLLIVGVVVFLVGKMRG